MGAGHDGAAREIARRLEDRGIRARVVDFLDAFAAPLARAWEGFYRFQLRYAPDTYESSYQLFYRYPQLWGPFVRFERLLAGRRVVQWVAETNPDVIVSTYSFATLVIGRLREERRVGVPVVNFLTDFGVHPRAVHPGVDLNLALHAVPAQRAAELSGRPTVIGGPAVRPGFGHAGLRERGRASLGFSPDDRVVLVVAGSWGIGDDLPRTVQALVASRRFRVVTVCGSDERLRRRLEAQDSGVVIGWTDRMAELMAAADVVVENAGGLSSLEAFATGVPVVTYRPIPGHGRDNARAMVAAGVTTQPVDDAELVDALSDLAGPGEHRNRQLAAAGALFDHDPITHIVSLAGAHGSTGTAPRRTGAASVALPGALASSDETS